MICFFVQERTSESEQDASRYSSATSRNYGGITDDPAPPQRTRRGGTLPQTQRSKAQPVSEAAVGKFNCIL